jgi:uncharacterized protein involved in exopolysaccharide biosynthesis
MATEKQTQSSYDFSSTDLLIYMWDKRVPLILISILAAIASIIISFMITPKFRSTVVMFPTTSTSISKNLLASNYSGRASLYEIGEEEQSEQLMQVLNSEQIRNRIIDKFNLMEHYEIDPESKFPMTQLYAEYKSNIKFKLTEYLSVVIEVMDKDPQKAADIANEISNQVDSVYNHMLKQRAIDAFHLVEEQYLEVLEETKDLQDSITKIRALGINDYRTQSERFNEALGRAITEGNERARRILERKLDTLSMYGGNYATIDNQLGYAISRLSDLKERYQEAKLEAEQNLPHKFVVDSAIKAEKKAYPKKSIIVIISTIAAFLLTLVTLIVVENIKRKI